MKITRITQLLSILVGTLTTVEAYDAPYGYGDLASDDKSAVLYFELPKATLNEVSIYHSDYHMKIYNAFLVVGPLNISSEVLPSWNNNNDNVSTPWISITNEELVNDEYSFFVVILPIENPLDFSQLNFVVSLNGTEGEQSFPVNFTLTPSGSLSSSSTISSTLPSSSSTGQTNPTSDLTPYGSGFYYQDKVYFNFFLPNSNFTEVGIWPTKKGKFSYELDGVYGLYEPSNIKFDVRTGVGHNGVSMKADLKFNEEDEYANILMSGLNTTSFVEDIFEFTVLLQNLPHQIEKRFDQEFTVSITMAPVGTVPTVSAS